jgi:hypothetical protein
VIQRPAFFNSGQDFEAPVQPFAVKSRQIKLRMIQQ